MKKPCFNAACRQCAIRVGAFYITSIYYLYIFVDIISPHTQGIPDNQGGEGWALFQSEIPLANQDHSDGTGEHALQLCAITILAERPATRKFNGACHVFQVPEISRGCVVGLWVSETDALMMP